MNMLPVHSLVLQVCLGIDRLSCNARQLSVDVEGEGAKLLNVDALSLSEVVAEVLDH